MIDSIAMRAACLSDTDDLERLIEARGSAVVLNHPAMRDELMSLGQALRYALRGNTRCFTAIVGYFHHRDELRAGKASGSSLANDDPARIIIEEALEEHIRLVQDETDFEGTAFRLLTGQFSSLPAAVAARAWYWMCRWKQVHPEAAIACRREFLQRVQDLHVQEGDGLESGRSFQQACEELFDPESPLSGLVQRHEFAEEVLVPMNCERADVVREKWEIFLAQIGALEDAGRKPLERGQKRAAAILFGFLLQRKGEVCVARGNTTFRGDRLASLATFHPKIYLVEQERPQQNRTIAFVGSNNWSDKALGAVETGRDNVGTLGNVELATVHAVAGDGWSDHEGAEIGQQVCAAARYIYESIEDVLGSWCGEYDVIEVGRAYRLTERVEQHDYVPTEEKGEDTGQFPEEVDEFLPHLKRLVEQLLGFEGSNHLKFYQDLFQSGELFGNRTPEQYQIDGALRLLAILARERGCFLTDEAGLGKTLVSKMVVTILLTRRLNERNRFGTTAPLKVSLIAPARLVGELEAEEGATKTASGWQAHRLEIENAVRRSLRDMNAFWEEVEPDRSARFDVEALVEMLDIRVISSSSFSRELLDKKALEDAGVEPDEATPEQMILRGSIVETLLHVASSEVVLIDESHNFRNPFSYGTRAIRYVLSLPVLGEQWPLDFPGKNEEEPGGSMEAERKILCLSATPFNNRLDDLITQIGHFNQYQDWKAPFPVEQLDIEGVRSELFEALNTWDTARLSSMEEDSLREAFSTITRHIYRHLRSGRSLSVDEDYRQEAERKARDARTRYSDDGPEYQWPSGSSEIRDTLAAALRWTKARKSLEGDEMDESQREQAAKAQARLDALLCRLMVQRSRARVLKIAEATRDENIDEMFRRPRVPRHPLPLNSSSAEKGKLESEVIDELYRLLDASTDVGNDEEEGFDGVPDLDREALTLFAYRIGVLRGRQGRSGSAEQTIRNSLGFQRVNLIKRLQSSPYAFLLTVLRGPLRRTMYELALVERLIAPMRVSRDYDGLLDEEKLREHPLAEELSTLEDSMIEFVDRVHGASSRYLDALARLLGGLDAPDEAFFFCELCGVYSPERSDELSDTTRAREFDRDFEKLCELLFPEEKEVSIPFDAGRFESSWANDVLEDIRQVDDGRSELAHDIERALDWALGRKRRDEKSLVSRIYGDLRKVSDRAGRSLYAAPMPRLRRALIDNDFKDPKHWGLVLDWLIAWLEEDGRLASLVAWLLLQRAGSLALGDDIVDVLPGGPRTLIFSEYTDTQEYLLCALTAMFTLVERAEDYDLDLASLEDVLLSRIGEMQESLYSRAESVSTPGRTHDFSRPADFMPPVPGDDMMEIWASLHDEDGDIRHFLREAILSLGKLTARVCSGETARLTEATIEAVDDESVHDGERLDISTDSLREDAILDAFSPWYQIAPSAGEEITREQSRGFLERLLAAHSYPVEVLFSTEVLSEGVNLQECGVIAHYDLPWNPTRLIQRNGRIDRRIFEVYEKPAKRKVFVERLLRKLAPEDIADFVGEEGLSRMEAGEVAVEEARERLQRNMPRFLAPEQVYHLTVVPVEPDRQMAGRVRELLLQKLETIRALFGLSSWPVVLDQEGAQEVLTGELEYETPGFRRREELFRHWSTLKSASESREITTGDGGPFFTLEVDVPASLRRELFESMTRVSVEEERNEMHENWYSLKKAGVFTWTDLTPLSHPVRSRPEWATIKTSEMSGAISGVLMLGDSLGQLVTTCEFGGETARLLPLLVRPHSEHPQSDMHTELAVADLYSLDVLERNSDEVLVDPSLPSTPTALAEEILVSFLDYLRTHAGVVWRMRLHRSPETPLQEVLREGLLERDIVRLLLTRLEQVNRLGLRSDKKPSRSGSGLSSGPDRDPSINLWLKWTS